LPAQAEYVRRVVDGVGESLLGGTVSVAGS